MYLALGGGSGKEDRVLFTWMLGLFAAALLEGNVRDKHHHHHHQQQQHQQQQQQQQQQCSSSYNNNNSVFEC